MNKILHIKKKWILTPRTYSVRFTYKGGENMEYVEPNIDYKLIGKRIKEARKKVGISQEKLGELIDVATAYVSRVERGSSHVNLKKLSQISVALNIPIEELVSDTTTKSKNYLSKEFQEVLSRCTPDQQSLIYNIARIVSEIEFI